MKKIALIFILLCVSGVIGFYIYSRDASSYVTLKTPFEEYDEYINFEYEKPIDGIKISGTFNPQEWGCAGYFIGDVSLVFTRLIDNKSFKFSTDQVTFFNSDICQDPKDYDKGCKFKDNIILKYEDTVEETTDVSSHTVPHTSDLLKQQPLKIVDFDFDGKEEIILLRACGVRHWEEFRAYDFSNTVEEFSINQNNFFYFNHYSEFDDKNKTITVGYPGGACINEKEFYKSDGTGYKLFKKIIMDRPEWSIEQDVPGLCEINTYNIDEKGSSTLVDTICHESIDGEWVDSQKCFRETSKPLK